MNGMLFTLPPRQQRNTVGWFAHPCGVTFTTDVFGNDLYLHFSHNVFFFISAKGGINFERFHKLSSIWKMFLLKVSTCTYAVCTPLSIISLFPILCSIAFWPPLHCAIYKRGEAAMFHCVHWFTPSEYKLLLVWAVSWAVSVEGKELRQCLVDWKK